MILRRAGTARRGGLILLQVHVRGLGLVADTVGMRRRVRALNALRARCHAHARATGGSLAVAAVGADDACLLSAWIHGGRRTRLDVRDAVRHLAAEARRALTRPGSAEGREATVEVALAVGACEYVQTGRRPGEPAGAGMRRLGRLSGRGPGGRDVILVDDSVRDRFADEDLEDLGDGIFLLVR